MKSNESVLSVSEYWKLAIIVQGTMEGLVTLCIFQLRNLFGQLSKVSGLLLYKARQTTRGRVQREHGY